MHVRSLNAPSRDGDLHDVRDLVSPHGGAIQSRPKLLGLTCARPEPLAHLDSSARETRTETLRPSEAFCRPKLLGLTCARPEPIAHLDSEPANPTETLRPSEAFCKSVNLRPAER